jgi:hypothetical protein
MYGLFFANFAKSLAKTLLCALLFAFVSISFAGLSSDEDRVSVFLTCKKFYSDKEGVPYVYDRNRPQKFVARNRLERELNTKYSSDDVIALYVNSTARSMSASPNEATFVQQFAPAGGCMKKQMNLSVSAALYQRRMINESACI